MKTSINSRLFLITYGIILVFLVGLIVLNNTFLERFYTMSRQDALISAFATVKDVDLTGDQDEVTEAMLRVENSYNLKVYVLEQVPDTVPPKITELPPYISFVYGDRFSVRGSQITAVINGFNSLLEGTAGDGIDVVDLSSSGDYLAFFTSIEPGQGGVDSPDGPTLLALCVGTEQDSGLYLYYILTITVQSIADSISIFNTFTIIIGLVFMVLGGILTFLYSKSFTNPILEMTEVTKRLSDLDFSTKVTTRTQDELGDLGNSINKMSDRLQLSIRDLQSANEKLAADIELKTNIDTMRREFIANASHELKTPISLIIGYSEAMRLPGLTPEELNEYHGIIDDEANKMNKLVMNLLKISQLESGFQQLTMMDFSLKDLVEETTKLFALKFTEKNVNLQVDVEDLFVNSDYDTLQTVLTNYVSNALNHVEGENLIRIQSSRLGDGKVRITVFNTGKPIPEDSLGRIWESFYKVDKARTRAYGGQGLGLSIVKISLENLGYDYGVKNVETGVEFYFDVPAPPSDSNQ